LLRQPEKGAGTGKEPTTTERDPFEATAHRAEASRSHTAVHAMPSGLLSTTLPSEGLPQTPLPSLTARYLSLVHVTPKSRRSVPEFCLVHDRPSGLVTIAPFVPTAMY
jgi:hypothetical protein